MTEPEASPLRDPSSLVSESWRIFRARFGFLMLVAGAGSAATLACAVLPFLAAGALELTGAASGVWPWIAATVVGLSAALWVASWAQVAACQAALAPEGGALSLRELARSGAGKVGAFSWVCLLYLLLVGGGLCFFIVPGLYLAAALVFAPMIVLEEGLTGFAALEQSLRYTRGRWNSLSWRLAIVGLLGGLPSMVPVVGVILGALLSPLPLVALGTLYRDASRAPAPDAGRSSRWALAVAALGWLWPVYVTYKVVPVVIARWPAIQEQAGRLANADPAKAQSLLDALQAGEGATPQTALLAAQFLGSVPAAPSSAPAVSTASVAAVQPPAVSANPALAPAGGPK